MDRADISLRDTPLTLPSKWSPSRAERHRRMNEPLHRRTFTHPLVLAQHVAGGTFTLVRAHHVDAAEGTQQGVLGTLVDIWTRDGQKLEQHRWRRRRRRCLTVHTLAGHHRPRLKAVITRTLEASDDIGACAVATGVADLTLVGVCKTKDTSSPLN